MSRVLRLQRAVHDQEVAVVEPRALHGVPGQAHEVRRGGVLDQQFMEVEVAVQVVVGGRGESGRRQRQDERAGQG